MNKYLKYMIVAATATVLFSTPALAGSTKASSCSTGDAKSSTYKKTTHTKIPGSTPDYIRNILKKGGLIGLTDKQRKQVGDQLIAAETGAAKAHAQAQIAVAGFRSKLHGGALSDSDIEAYTKRMGELRTAKLEANLKASVKASRLLSDEQKSRLYAGKKYKGANK